MPPELRLLAWKSARDGRRRLAWGLGVLAALVVAGFIVRAMLLDPSTDGIWAQMKQEASAAGVRLEDTTGFLRRWWHEGGLRPGILILAGLLGAAGPRLDAGGGSRLLHFSLPARRELPVAMHALVATVSAVAASAWVAFLTVIGSAVTGSVYPLSEAVAMTATGAVLSAPAVALGVLAATLSRRPLTAGLLALLAVWVLERASPLLGPWSPLPRHLHDAWAPGRNLLPALVCTTLLFALSLLVTSKENP